MSNIVNLPDRAGPINVEAEKRRQKIRVENLNLPRVSTYSMLKELADLLELEADAAAELGPEAGDIVRNLCHFSVILRAHHSTFSVVLEGGES